ncbi:hypothetical protein Amsp01_090940 [Amycolatopsis sp. NBRC 101858]|nr:hypothetical protein Amsp01_090940 [Amycolatopsis sp. NBRC 101858]
MFGATNGSTVAGWKTYGVTPPSSCTGFVITGLLGVRGALSAFNLTNRTQKLYKGFNCSGTPVSIPSGGAVANLGTATYNSIGG